MHMRTRGLLTTFILGMAALAAACTPAAEPTTPPTATTAAAATATIASAPTSTTGTSATATARSAPTTAAATATPAPTPTTAIKPTATPVPAAHLYVLSNPNKITEVDAETFTVMKDHTIDIPGGGRWAYNDENNYFDGTNLWLLTRNSNGAANDLGVMALNINTMQVVKWFNVGQGNFNPFVGKATKDGVLPVGLRDLGQMATFNTKTVELIKIYDVPLGLDSSGKPLYKKDYPNPADTTGGGAVVCDMDIIEVNGKELAVYPTQGTELVVAVDPYDGSFVSAGSIAKGSKGNMLTTSLDRKYVWAQENGTNSQAVMDPATMQVVGRVPTGMKPSFNSFSPDGKFTFISGGDRVITVADTSTFKVVATVDVGPNSSQSVAHPNGKTLYSYASKELKLVAIDTANWQVTKTITLGSAPSGLFIRKTN